jgi:hypothetical protein
MNSTKHTQGPWHVFISERAIGVSSARSDLAYTRINEPPPIPMDSERAAVEDIANAHLIAAAPELLVELESIAEIFNTDGESPTTLRAQMLTSMQRIAPLIAKARGEA